MVDEHSLIVHVRESIMAYVANQAKPLIGDYRKNKDYFQKMLDGIISTSDLAARYSSVDKINYSLGNTTQNHPILEDLVSTNPGTKYSSQKSSTYGQINSYE